MTRLLDLCKSVRDGSARHDDVQELAVLSEQVQKKIDAVWETIDRWTRDAEGYEIGSEEHNVYVSLIRELKKEIE